MKKKIVSIFLSIIILVFFAYLLLPPPPLIPDLPGSLKSVEPGDTVEIPGLSAYYTDLDRESVIKFYEDNYSHSSFMKIPLLIYRLNHPVEYSRETIRDTLQSSYYEEIVHPFRESLYVNGYEWENDPFAKSEQKAQNKSIINGREFKSKITIIVRNSNPMSRMIVFTGILIAIWWMFIELKGLFKDFKNIFK